MFDGLLSSKPAPLSRNTRKDFAEAFLNVMNDSLYYDAACKALANALGLKVIGRADLALEQYGKYPKTREELAAKREVFLENLKVEARDKGAEAFDAAMAQISQQAVAQVG